MGGDNMSEIVDDALAVLFLEEPHLKELGDSVISPNACEHCSEHGVYNGPEIKFTDIGRCMVCGTMNKVD